MARFCTELLAKAKMKAGKDGWHRFAVVHLQKLIQVARNHLNITVLPPALPKPPAERQAWTGKRIARLATMACEGYTAKTIADDPEINSTPSAVYRAAHKFEIWLSEKPRGQVNVRLPLDALAFYQREAEARGLTRDACMRRVLIAAAQARPAPSPLHRSDSTSARGELV